MDGRHAERSRSMEGDNYTDGINSVEVESDTQGDILYLVIPNPFDETTFEVRTGEVTK
jgi:hypothetical protein